MALIPEDKIAEVRDRSDIVQIVGEHVTLKRSGVNHKGLCPFHGEKTPSFNVNSQKQIFHCFGCGKSGDVIGFLMEVSGRPFVEVVRDLARRAGVTLPSPDEGRSPREREAARRSEADKSRLYKVNALAAEFFRGEYDSPRGARARAYVDGRGISREVLEAFRIGHAPAGWDGLVRYLEAKKVPHELAERAGLVRRRDNVRLVEDAPPSKTTHFDLFRDRVMCPVIDASGEVVAFSGRVLEGDGPKYINSPESPVYRKGEHLYGLHVAKAAMRRSGRAILVEGNFDVLAMHVHGFGETVAPLGTALTPRQAHLVHRFAPGKVYLFLDGDAAGQRAAARDVSVFLDEDLLSFVASLPRGDDPDTFLRKEGRDAVERLLAGAQESVEYFCSHAWKQSGGSIVERVKLFEEQAAPVLRRVKNPTARQKYTEQLAQELDLPPDVLRRVVSAGVKAAEATVAAPVASPAPVGPAAPAPPPKLATTDVEIVALLADHPRLMMRLGALGVPRIVDNDALRGALETLSRRTESAAVDARALADAVGPALRAEVVRAASSSRYADVADPERAMRAIVQRVERDRNLVELKKALAAARAAGNEIEQRRVNAEIERLNQQRLALKS